MKVILLAGGRGTRLSELTETIPKPMVRIGDAPILAHIMKIYADHGFREFVVALGYLGEVVKDFFVNYHRRKNSLTVDLGTGDVTVHEPLSAAHESWLVHLLDTGLETATSGRVRAAMDFIERETCMLTYGDGVADVDISELVRFHERHGKLATITAVHPPARFGELTIEAEGVTRFEEKPQTKEGWINGGFFVLSPGVYDYLAADDVPFERDPLSRLAADGQLVAYRHTGFWQCLDTLRDLQYLDGLARSGDAPWIATAKKSP